MEAKVVIDDNAAALRVFGQADEHLRLLEQGFRVEVISRGNELSLRGDKEEVEKAVRALTDLIELSQGEPVGPREVQAAIELAKNGSDARLHELSQDVVQVTARGKRIVPKTLGQRQYIEALRKHDIVFCIGPAGTGKTYLALAQAVASLKAKNVQRLILTRPAVEAGEKLGFLPGDLQEKVDPYLRPMYDALYDIMGTDGFQRAQERGMIEVAPLAYMRGRTLDDAFIVLDEAQNTTPEQMKMFLTRLGFRSKMVITGDVTQVDLPAGTESGLIQVQRILRGIPGIAFVYLSEGDVVRHELVQAIVKAYDQHRHAPLGAHHPANGQAYGWFPAAYRLPGVSNGVKSTPAGSPHGVAPTAGEPEVAAIRDPAAGDAF